MPKRFTHELIETVLDSFDADVFTEVFPRGMSVSLPACEKAAEKLCEAQTKRFLQLVCTPAAFKLYKELRRAARRTFTRSWNKAKKDLEQGRDPFAPEEEYNEAHIKALDKCNSQEEKMIGTAIFHALSKGVSKRSIKKLGLTDLWPGEK